MRRLTLFLAFSAACTATACEAPTRLAGWNARQLKMDVRVIDEGSLAVDVYVLDDRKHVLSCPTARDDLHVFIDDAELSVDPGGWYTSSEEYVSTRGCRPWSARVFRPGELPMETGVPSILSLEDDDSLVEFEVPGLRSPQIVHYTGRDGGLLRPGADMEMHFDEPWTPILDWREPRINLDTDQYNYTVTLTDPGVEQLDDGTLRFGLPYHLHEGPIYVEHWVNLTQTVQGPDDWTLEIVARPGDQTLDFEGGR